MCWRDIPNSRSACYLLPGNHDVNIVDRANPARLDLPFSQTKRLRQWRTLAAMANLQGERVTVIDGNDKTHTLASALDAHRGDAERFCRSRAASAFLRGWQDSGMSFIPMMLPPETDDGLGVVILNSNAETHFSFTNALGLHPHAIRRGACAISSGCIPRHHGSSHCIIMSSNIRRALKRSPSASEPPWSTEAGSCANWRRSPHRAVVMHGHRHIDWIGACGPLRIISAPSPVMGHKRRPHAFLRPHAGDIGRRAAAAGRAATRRSQRSELTLRRRAREFRTTSASSGCCSQKATIAIVIGTPMKAPNRPQMKAPRKTANSTSVGDMDSALPAIARLEIAADHELDDVEADEDADGCLPTAELENGKRARKERRDEGADERDVIECEGDDAPFGSELQSDRPGEEPDQKAGHQAHLGAHPHIAPDLRCDRDAALR